MASIVTPKSFYIKARKDYADWRFAFWRENIQNSVDAGCSTINITITDLGNNNLRIAFDDNGRGMTKEILDDVYFKLGESTKNNGAFVGGFGLARMLTCFSMKSYTILTQNNLVQGDGGEYEIVETEYYDGCRIEVEMENETFSNVKKSLEQCLIQSQLPCKVFVNGVRWTQWSHRRTLTRELEKDGKPFAGVYVNKSAANSLLMIRVNGTIMFSQYTRAKAQVIVEINPDVARSVLTAHRDGMTYEYKSVLDEFINEMAADTTSALKNRFTNKNATILGQGLIYSISNKVVIKTAEKTVVDKESLVGKEGNTVIGFGQETIKFVTFGESKESGVKIAEVAGTEETLNQFNQFIDKQVTVIDKDDRWAGRKFLRNLPDIYIEDDTENPEVHSVINQYHPDNWVVMETGGKLYNKGNKFYKLLMLWKIACQEAIDALMAYNPSITNISWGLGWVFSDQSMARCKSIQGGHAFLLNPVDEKGKVCFSLRDKKDLKKLMALAKHEVSHTYVRYHDEDFARALTGIDGQFDEKETFRKMADFLS